MTVFLAVFDPLPASLCTLSYDFYPITSDLFGAFWTLQNRTSFMDVPYHYGILPHTNKIWIILILKSSEDLALIRWLK